MSTDQEGIQNERPVTLIAGHCLDVLKTMAPESIHCCVTSPPYWGLRDYHTENKIWGGDRWCIHTWNRANVRDSRAGSFCIPCGAWLGSLGLEPTPELDVNHVATEGEQVAQRSKIAAPAAPGMPAITDGELTSPATPQSCAESTIP